MGKGPALSIPSLSFFFGRLVHPGGRRESVLSEEVLSHFRADSQHLGLILWVAPELTSPEPNDLFVAQQHQRIDGDEP